MIFWRPYTGAHILIFSEAMLPLIPKETPVGTALWPFKHTVEQLNIIENGDPYTSASQYQQDPSPLGGGMFKSKYWRYYEVLPPNMDLIRIYCDTAQKTKEHNDYSVFECWGRVPGVGVFLLDLCRGKWEAPELESKFVEFWQKHKPRHPVMFGAQMVKVEDKSSGSSLIQTIQRDYVIPIEPIQRNTDKVFRAMGVIPYFASGYVHIPKNADFTFDFTEEFRKFSPLGTHAHDDQIDPAIDAIEDLLVSDTGSYSKEALS